MKLKTFKYQVVAPCKWGLSVQMLSFLKITSVYVVIVLHSYSAAWDRIYRFYATNI